MLGRAVRECHVPRLVVWGSGQRWVWWLSPAQGQLAGSGMRETPKIVSLATALAALATPAAAPPIVDSDGNDGPIAVEPQEGSRAEDQVRVERNLELMSFTVHRTADGMLFPQHSSHSSHSSHASHASHASSSPGFGVPSLPDPGYAPPVYPPPVVAPPAATTAPGPAASGVDIAYIACARASAGFGVTDISSELVSVYGVAGDDAVSIAKQALASVLGSGQFCDAYKR